MHIIVEIVLATLMIVYYVIEGIIKFILPPNRKNIKGQIVLITGAGSGLGRLMAHRFARLGCKIVLWDVNGKSNEQTATEIREFGGTSYAYTCDLSNKDAIYQTAAKVKSDVGDVDILINNAGIVTGKKLLDCPDPLIEKTMAVNIIAHFWTVKSFLPSMLTKNRGHVVTIASAAGFFGVAGLADYCSSKSAAVGFDSTIRNELSAQKKTGIHTTVVCPYYIDTGMFDGVKVRFPSLLPILSPDYVVDKIISAVLCNQQILILPRLLYPCVALQHILPVRASNVIEDLFEINKDMDSFKGRSKQN